MGEKEKVGRSSFVAVLSHIKTTTNPHEDSYVSYI